MLAPRPYQQETADCAIRQNTIINIKTGGGKTLIAVLVINHFLKFSPEKTVLFIVPSRALVTQQSQYLREQCILPSKKPVYVVEMCGQEMESWTRAKWQDHLKYYHVFVGTPEVFRRAFVDQGFLIATRFSLIVFDECHNAVGNSPMASLMRDAVLPLQRAEQPRILGLTASFINGSLKNMLEKRRKLETLLQSNIISPDVTDVSTENKTFHAVNVPIELLQEFKDAVIGLVKQSLDTIPESLIEAKEKKRWTERGWVVFEGLGTEGLVYWLQEGILHQLLAESDELAKRPDFICQKKAQRMKASLSNIRASLQHQPFRMPQETVSFPCKTQKFICLLKLLWSIFLKSTHSNGDKSFRGVVFVEQVALTYPIAHGVNNYFSEVMKQDVGKILSNCPTGGWPMKPISGTGSMLDSVRNKHLSMFRNGDVPLLVSTCALEEGIDVPECSFIVRYDSMATTKSHIQGSGRARCEKADIFYFQNDPQLECSRYEALEAVAKDKNLNLSQSELVERLEANRCPQFHPEDMFAYPYFLTGTANQQNSSAQVNFFNCISILYKYVQVVMHQSFNPEVSLFETATEIISKFPLQQRKVLLTIKYPTPDGILSVEAKQINDFWAGHDVADVVTPLDRLANLDVWDIEKRRAVYVVVLLLHKKGLLDTANHPTQHATANTKLVCEAYIMKPRIKIKNRFPALENEEQQQAPKKVKHTNVKQGN